MTDQTTKHFQLSRWGPKDPFARRDFRRDNEILDAALAQRQVWIMGLYTGDAGKNGQTVRLGFAPSTVLVVSRRGVNTGELDNILVQLAFRDHPAELLRLTEDGLVVEGRLNSSTSWGDYRYLALP